MTSRDFRNTADSFTKAYVRTALWSSTDDNDSPMDSNYDVEDFAEETLDKIVADCAKFQEAHWDTMHGSSCSEGSSPMRRSGDIDEQGGHDFWLTRNGHGAGFWDGDWEEEIGETLTEASKTFGGADLYIGDDGRIYQG